MMRLGDAGQKLIKHYEQLRLAPYHGAADRPDLWSIGWGATRYLDGSRIFPTTPPITEFQAQALFLRDTFAPLQCVEACIQRELGQNQIDALVALVYNIGEANFEHSTLRRNINRGEDDRIEAQWLKWDHANGKEVKGLFTRRQSEYALFLG